MFQLCERCSNTRTKKSASAAADSTMLFQCWSSTLQLPTVRLARSSGCASASSTSGDSIKRNHDLHFYLIWLLCMQSAYLTALDPLGNFKEQLLVLSVFVFCGTCNHGGAWLYYNEFRMNTCLVGFSVYRYQRNGMKIGRVCVSGVTLLPNPRPCCSYCLWGFIFDPCLKNNYAYMFDYVVKLENVPWVGASSNKFARNGACMCLQIYMHLVH